jgi:hypothetical protein
MANNVSIGPNAMVAKADTSFDDAGITSTNVLKIILVDAELKSYVPGRSINGITGFVTNKGYFLVAKQAMDLSAVLVPPTVDLTALATPGSFIATSGDGQNVLDWADVTNATGYVVDRATNSGFTTGVALAIYSGSTSGYTDTGRTNGTQYFYRVRATGSGYADSAFATANATPAAGVALQDLNFATNTGLTNTAGDWTAGATGWVDHGLANKKIASGTNGYLQLRFVNLDQFNAILGFNTTSEDASYSNMEAGFYFIDTGAISINIIESGGVAALPSFSGAINDYYRLDRTGSVITLKHSADGTTYTTIYTYTFASAADLFINAVFDGGKLRQPKGYNLA